MSVSAYGEAGTSVGSYAVNNYWGYYYPSSYMFRGPVLYSPSLSAEPSGIGAGSGVYMGKVVMAGTGAAAEPVISAAQADLLSDQVPGTGMTFARLKQEAQELRAAYARNANSLHLQAKLLRQLDRLVRLDRADKTGEQAMAKGLERELRIRNKQVLQLGNAAVRGGNRSEGFEEQFRQKKFVLETLQLMALERSFRAGDASRFTELLDSLTKSGVNPDIQVSALQFGFYKALDLQELSSAEQLLTQLKQVKPEPVMEQGAGFTAYEWSGLENELRQAKGLPPLAVTLPVAENAIPATSADISVGKESQLPKKFALGAAFPNPFNPQTVLRYELPNNANVRIQVYSISGQLVQELVRSEKPAGRHEVSWNASAMSSGVYLVRAQLGKEFFTQKITLLK